MVRLSEFRPLETINPQEKSNVTILLDPTKDKLVLPIVLQDNNKMPVYANVLEEFIGFAWTRPQSNTPCDWCNTTTNKERRWAVLRNNIHKYATPTQSDLMNTSGERVHLCHDCYVELSEKIETSIQNNTETIVANNI